MGDMWFRAVPVAVAGCFARKGDEVTGTLKVPQPARRRRGVTLIEAVLYIAVALALIVGGLVFYQQASTAARINSLVTMLTSVIAEARAAQSESNTTLSFPTPADFTSYLVTRGSVPEAWLDRSYPPNEQIRHPWGGFVQFGSGIVTGVNPYHLVTVTMSDVPMQLCVRLGATFGNGATVYSGGYLGGLAYDVFSPPFPGSIDVGFSIDQTAARCKLGDTNNDGKVTLSQTFAYGSS